MRTVDRSELSLWQRLSLEPRERQVKYWRSLTDERRKRLPYDWRIHARPKQRIPEGDWMLWVIRSGRGWGKTRTGAETIRQWVETGEARRIALIGRTAADTRKTMVEGETGLLAISPPWNKPEFRPATKRLVWPSGAVAELYSGDEPDQLRGPQWHKCWMDEPAHWQYLQAAVDNMFFGLRLGNNPQVIATTTPLPVKAFTKLLDSDNVVVTTGNSYENTVLPDAYFQRNIAPYEGTRLGRQEIYGDILDDVPGALWTRELIDKHRVKGYPELVRVVVAIDPAVTNTEDSDSTGIVVAGLAANGHAYVREDATCRLDPVGWGRRAIQLFDHHQADEIIAEVNNGGDLVERNLTAIRPWIPFRKVTATRGKVKRAEPIATLYERGLVHHVGEFEQLEDEMALFTPDQKFADSPDRADALVWAIWALMVQPAIEHHVVTYEDPFTVGAY